MTSELIGRLLSPMTLSVLLADSSDSVKKALELGLRDYKTTVNKITSNILEEAIRLKPDIVFVDVLLEQDDGYTICEKIKSKLDKTKVVIMTSSFLRLDEERFLQVKADANLKKPFDIRSLKEIINNLFKSNEKPLGETGQSCSSETQNIDDFSNVPLSKIGSSTLKHTNLDSNNFSLKGSYEFEDSDLDVKKPSSTLETAIGLGRDNIFSNDFDPVEGINEGLDVNLDTRLSRDEQVEILANTTRDMVKKLLPNIVTRYVKEELRKLMSKTDE